MTREDIDAEDDRGPLRRFQDMSDPRGNNIGKAFDVDVRADTPEPIAGASITLPVQIR